MVANLIALVLPLGLDTFAVAAAIGTIGVTSSTRTRVTALFTLFEAGMPLVGLALGAPLGHAIGGAAEYVAIGVLIVFGIYTLTPNDDDERIAELAQMRGLRAVALGLSISFDELAIGFTLGLLHISAALVIVLIAAQTVIVTQLGLRLGSRLGERIREGAERLAGLALATLGLVLLAEKSSPDRADPASIAGRSHRKHRGAPGIRAGRVWAPRGRRARRAPRSRAAATPPNPLGRVHDSRRRTARSRLSGDLMPRGNGDVAGPSRMEQFVDVGRYASESIQRSSRRASRAISPGSRKVLVSKAIPW